MAELDWRISTLFDWWILNHAVEARRRHPDRSVYRSINQFLFCLLNNNLKHGYLISIALQTCYLKKKEKKKNPDERVVVWSQPYWQQRLFSKIGDGIKWALKSIYNLPQILYFRGGSSSGEEANDGATDWQTDRQLSCIILFWLISLDFGRRERKLWKITKKNQSSEK